MSQLKNSRTNREDGENLHFVGASLRGHDRRSLLRFFFDEMSFLFPHLGVVSLDVISSRHCLLLAGVVDPPKHISSPLCRAHTSPLRNHLRHARRRHVQPQSHVCFNKASHGSVVSSRSTLSILSTTACRIQVSLVAALFRRYEMRVSEMMLGSGSPASATFLFGQNC